MLNLICDSASDITQSEADALSQEGVLKVVVVPLTISFGDHIYRDGIDISHKRFYELLIESDELPKTSQVTPFAYTQALSEVADGDEILVMTLSAKLSSTMESALAAVANFGRPVHVVDTENVCVGERILIERACALAKEGRRAEEIVHEIKALRGRVRLVALLDTLEYLKRGGRVSALAAGVGTMLSIKPVISVVDGNVEMIGKARGSKNGKNLLTECIERAGGIDFSMPYALGYAGLSDELLRKYIDDSHLLWESTIESPSYHLVGATIGTHTGPGAIAVAFFGRQ